MRSFADTMLILPPLGCKALDGRAWASLVSASQCPGGTLHQQALKGRLPMIPQPQLVPQLTTTSHLESTPAILTEEGTPIEADGGLACHLGSIKDCIIELVREGKGLWTKGRRLKVGEIHY